MKKFIAKYLVAIIGGFVILTIIGLLVFYSLPRDTYVLGMPIYSALILYELILYGVLLCVALIHTID